ncbi:MAG: type II toxin-antitoxin system RelE/ParE family toxin [Ferruginibacter sp.]
MAKKEETTPQIIKVKVLAAALLDIEQIADYIAVINQQPLNAIYVAESIWQTIEKIGVNPLSFKECIQIPTKRKIYRQAICLSWLIIYKVTTTEILILAIIHGSRKPSKIKSLVKKNLSR